MAAQLHRVAQWTAADSVTGEMIEAGIRALSAGSGTMGQIATAIYKAMRRAKP
jgi:hypothetical protein